GDSLAGREWQHRGWMTAKPARRQLFASAADAAGALTRGPGSRARTGGNAMPGGNLMIFRLAEHLRTQGRLKSVNLAAPGGAGPLAEALARDQDGLAQADRRDGDLHAL